MRRHKHLDVLLKHCIAQKSTELEFVIACLLDSVWRSVNSVHVGVKNAMWLQSRQLLLW